MQNQITPAVEELKSRLRAYLAGLSDDALVQQFMALSTEAQLATTGHARELADLHKVAATAVLSRFCPQEFGNALALCEEFAA